MDAVVGDECGTEMHTHGTLNGRDDADVEVGLGI